MQRNLKLLLIMIAGSAVLSACGYNPNIAVPTQVQQCNALQRQILFGDENANGNPSNFSQVSQRTQLRQEFNKMHCYQTLQEAKQTGNRK